MSPMRCITFYPNPVLYIPTPPHSYLILPYPMMYCAILSYPNPIPTNMLFLPQALGLMAVAFAF